jgi:hypothetical protein
MPQGSRGRWVRAAFTGLGIVLMSGTMGCMNDKDKLLPPKFGANKQPGTGLPNTRMLPGTPGSGLGSTAGGQPSYNNYGGMQPTGGFAGSSGAGKPYGGTGYTTGAGGSSGFGAGGVVPSMGSGAMPGGSAEFGGSPTGYGGSAGSSGYGGYKDAGSSYGGYGGGSPAAPGLGVPGGPIPPAPPGGGLGAGDVTPPAAPLAPGLKPSGY